MSTFISLIYILIIISIVISLVILSNTISKLEKNVATISTNIESVNNNINKITKNNNSLNKESNNLKLYASIYSVILFLKDAINDYKKSKKNKKSVLKSFSKTCFKNINKIRKLKHK